MVGTGQVLQIVRHLVRGTLVAGQSQSRRPLGERGEHLAVRLGVKQAQVSAFGTDARSGRVAVHIAGTRVRILHVVHRVLIGMRSQQIQIDIHRRVVVGTGQRVTGRIHANGLNQIVDGDDVASALRHAYGLAVLHHIDQLADENLHVHARLVAEGGAHGHHTTDIAMMVGAEHVNRHVGRIHSAVTLVPVVGDVGSEVGEVTVRLDDDAVLVIAMLGGFKPGGSILLEDVAATAQLLNRAVDFSVLV